MVTVLLYVSINDELGKNVIIFGAGNSLSVHTDNTKKYIAVIFEGPAYGLDDTTTMAETKYPINITKSRKKICLSLHCNAVNNFLHANGVKIHKFKAKDSKTKPYLLCSENISKDVTVNNMKKTALNGKVYHFFVSYETTDVSDIEVIHKYLMRKHKIV